MKIIGCDFHPSYQQIAMLDTETGMRREVSLRHADGEARRFYEQLSGPVRVGMEACGNTQWFERMLAELGHELWLGDAAKIRASEVRKQKTDKRDAALILQLLVEERFPKIWVPSMEQRDQRQLLIHRHKLVEVRSRVKNGLQHLALNQGLQKKRSLWSKAGQQQLQELPLQPWAGRRRSDLFDLLKKLDAQIAELDRAVQAAAAQNADAQLLMTHPGVGPVIGLAFVLTLGDVTRFARSRQVASYLGLIPSEHSTGGKQKLGAISKQGNTLMRSLLVEGGLTAARYDADLKRAYQRLKHRKNHGKAKVMVARKLAIRLYWMLRCRRPYPWGSHAGEPGSSRGRGSGPVA